MASWIRVITQPLGLAGFALFLIFGYLAKAKQKDQRRWFSPAAAALAIISVSGGLVLAYVQISKPSTPIPQIGVAPIQQQQNQVQQTTTGPGSPAVQGVQGDVTVNVDQSGEQRKERKPTSNKPTQPNK
jgi:hypothetical protein